MQLSQFLAGQLGNPSRLFGGLAGSVWNRRNAALNDTVLELLALQPADRVLDVGFGGGYLLDRMSRVVDDGWLAGVDISPAIVAAAQKRYRAKVNAGMLGLACAAADALPFPDEHFTKVCSVNSIFYWHDVEQGLREIARVLVKGGHLVLCFTSMASLEQKGFARHIDLVEPTTLDEIMRAIGLRDIRTSTFADRHRTYICMIARHGSLERTP
ncbi:MAG: methyltransferase domain-containing protein [Anaerolineae bacterium]|nr:methyltransferase domain-containing protein [Caldilinea sp.]MCB0245985.1 methyltransferase domain-containing protein [Anaerolineae bacterium]